MPRRQPRSLRPDEEELWRRIAATAKPLQAPRARPREPSDDPAQPRPRAEADGGGGAPAVAPFRIGSAARPSTAVSYSPDPHDRLSGAPMRIDRRTHARLKKGKLPPDARIDLHGMTLSQAHSALAGFVAQSHAAGRRLLLVITGKGRDDPMSTRRGMLRHQVPDWLAAPPLAMFVQQVLPAHRSHGGSGAYYVYLRRKR